MTDDDLTEEEVEHDLEELDEEIEAAKARLAAESHERDETFIGANEDEGQGQAPG